MPENKDNGSLLRSAIVATPAVAGVGIGIRGLIREGIAQPRASSVSKAMATLRKIEATRPGQINMADHLEFLRGHANYFRAEGAEVARQAWVQAMATANPLAREELMTFTKNIRSLPAHQVYSAIENTMLAQESNLAQSIYRRFRFNTAQLVEHHTLTGMIPTFMDVAVGELGAPGTRALEPELQTIIRRVEKELGVQGETLASWYSRPGWAAEGLGSYQFTFRAPTGAITMTVPIAQKGVLSAGELQQTRYIAPDVWIYNAKQEAVQKMTRQEYLLSEFERRIVPEIKAGKLEGFQIEKAIRDLNTEVIGSLENIVNAPADIRTQALRTYERIRGQQVEVMIRDADKIRRATEDELANLVSMHPELYGGTSPTAIAQGRLSRLDLSQYTMVPEAADWSRRLEQGYREYELTEEARRAMFTDPSLQRYQRYRKYETAASRELEAVMTRPHLKTMYVDPERHAALLQQLHLGEGEALARRGLHDIMQFQAVKSAHLVNIRSDLMDAVKQGMIPHLEEGEIIGTTAEGDFFKYSKNMRLLKGIENRSRNRGDYLSLFYMDTRRLESNDKIFQDIKALVRLKDDEQFARAAQRFSTNFAITDNLDMIASMDELKKDTGKHTRQIISSLGEVFEKRSVYGPGPAQDFWRDPEEMVKLWRKAAVTGERYSHKRFVQEAMSFAMREGELTPKEFQAVFGAVPTVLGETTTEELVQAATGASAKRYLKALQAGIAGGIAKVAYSEPAFLTGAGAMGSLEPRALDILYAGPLGQFGKELAEEFTERLRVTTPEKLLVHQELTKTLKSAVGAAKPTALAATWDVAARGYEREAFQTWIERGGGWIKPGKGMHAIYVPGATALRTMLPQQIEEQKIYGWLSDTYHQLAKDASKLHTEYDRITSEEYLKRLERAMGDVHRHWAPAGKGMGAVTRGKMLGSRFLRGVSQAGGWASTDPFVAGITERYFKEMQREMLATGLYDSKRLREMATRFQAGEEIGGMVARHPFIGEFSIQPMRFRKIEGVGRAEIVLPEIGADIAVKGSPGPKRITIGPLVGFSGDKDADIYSAILLSPDAEAKARHATMELDSEFTQRYTQHQVRYQMLKAKRAAADVSEMTIRERMIADIRKLGTTQRWVPQLSLELSAAKRALAAHGQGMAAADARMLLEWLEQTPISAKHLSALELREGGLGALMEEITSSLQLRGERGANRLERVVRGIMSSDTEAEKLLERGIELEMESAEELSRIMGRDVDRTIKGVEVQKAVKELFTSMDKFEASGAAKMAERMAARGGRIKLHEIPELAARSATSIFESPRGMFSGVSRATTAASNLAGAVGRGILKHHKPIGLGFAGSVALAAALSTPDETVGPGLPLSSIRMNMNVAKAASRVKPEDVMPSQQTLGKPTVPAMMAGQRAMIGGPGPSRQVTVKARANYMVNSGQVAGELSGISGRYRTNINIRDHRSSLNKHAIANKLY